MIAGHVELSPPKNMTSSLGHSTSLLDQPFDGFPDLLFVVSREGVILDYRGGREARLYAPPDAFLGCSLNAVLPPSVGTHPIGGGGCSRFRHAGPGGCRLHAVVPGR